MKQKINIGLIGNPNCGKSTLFNSLTGSRQQVGNWSGVTVERKTGQFIYANTLIEVIDLPGIYNLTATTDSQAIDEQIASQAIMCSEIDIILNIIDATNIERSLFLTTQLLEMQLPMLLVINMMDMANKQGLIVNLEQLAKEFDCKVLGISAHKKKGLTELKDNIIALSTEKKFPGSPLLIPTQLDEIINNLATTLQQTISHANTRYMAIRLLEGDQALKQKLSSCNQIAVAKNQQEISKIMGEDAEIIFADIRYSYIQQLCQQTLQRNNTTNNTATNILDNILLNRFLGIPFFFLAMYLMFLFAINIGGAFQDFFDISSQAIFVQGLSNVLTHFAVPNWLTALLAIGIGKGINTTLTFVPVISAMFFSLSFLEASGYMSRAAFIMDRFMRALGLPGKSFVPMIVGFGCNVPAIMSSRTLESRRDRILTIMMSPFMSCGARLAIYAVFTAAFFPTGGQNVVFILYLFGILLATLTGLILQKTLLPGKPSPLVMELPPYHWPTFKVLFNSTWHRLKSFLFRAGKLIIPICMLIGMLNAVNIDGTLNTQEANENSLLSVAGKTVTPIFAPMGIAKDNWPATVGLLTGVLAKEVVIGSLNTLYTQIGHITAETEANTTMITSLKTAIMSIPQNLIDLKNSFGNPILASAPIQTVDQKVMGVMFQHFDGQIGAFAYLLFILLYFPCISATAAIMRELSLRWAIFSVSWMTGIAYGVATIFYQTATFNRHPYSSVLWISLLLNLFAIVVLMMRNYAFGTPKFIDKLPPQVQNL